MTIRIVIERGFNWKPGIIRTTVVDRVWWGWFAIARVKVNEHEYATTAYDWIDPAEEAHLGKYGDWRDDPGTYGL